MIDIVLNLIDMFFNLFIFFLDNYKDCLFCYGYDLFFKLFLK